MIFLLILILLDIYLLLQIHHDQGQVIFLFRFFLIYSLQSLILYSPLEKYKNYQETYLQNYQYASKLCLIELKYR